MLDDADETLIRILEHEIRELEDHLRPAYIMEAMAVLRRLFRALPLGGKTEPEDVPSNFRLAVTDYPLWAVKEVVASFIAGTVDTHSGEWCPTCAVFGKELARRVADDRVRLIRLRRQRAEARKIEGGKPVPLSPELRALGERRCAELREATRQDRQRYSGTVASIPRSSTRSAIRPGNRHRL